MKLIYKPSYTDGYSKIAGQDVAMLICLPDEYPAEKRWPVKIFCHGMGQRGPGTKGALDTVFSGPYQAIPDDWKSNIDKLGIIGVLVNYNDFFQPASWRFVDQYMRNNYNVVDKFMRQGFSWGGGSLNRAMQQADIAAATAVAILIAPTVEAGDTNWKVPAKSGAVTWVHVNTGDPANPNSKGDDVVGKGPAISIVNGINANAPVVTATLTGYKAEGHGGTNEAVGSAPPSAPGGQGLTNAIESADQLYLRVLTGDVSAPKSGGTVPVPPVVIPPSNVKAITSFTIKDSTVFLVGSKSTGYSQGYEGIWELVSAPEGVTSKLVFPTGSSYIDATGKLPVQGTYVFKFSLKGAEPVLVTVQMGPVTTVKTPASYSITLKLLTYSDGSTEAATAAVTTASGKTYSL